MAFKLAQQQVLTRPTARPAVGRRAVVVPRAAIMLKDPPYALDALEPHMSKQTLEFHWGKVLDQIATTTVHPDLQEHQTILH